MCFFSLQDQEDLEDVAEMIYKDLLEDHSQEEERKVYNNRDEAKLTREEEKLLKGYGGTLDKLKDSNVQRMLMRQVRRHVLEDITVLKDKKK